MADWTDLFGSGAFQGGAAALGGGADIYAFIRNEEQRQARQRILDILSNPQQLQRYISKLYQPMSAAENTAVHRDLGANWATMTGGAPGGAMNQYVADALAKIESQRYGDTANRAIQSLSGAAGVQNPQMPMGNLSNLMRSLMILKRIRGDNGTPPGPTPGITVPTQGGPGYGGGSEQWRNQGPFPVPTTPGIPDDYSRMLPSGEAGYS